MHKLLFQIRELRVQIHKLIHELRVQIRELRV